MRSASVFALVALSLASWSAAAAGDGKSTTSEAPTTVASSATPRTKVPLRVVKVLPETRQVLLFDKNRGTHVLAEVGTTIAGYTVDDIDDDEVTLRTSGGAEIVLVVPAAPSAHGAREVDAKQPAIREVDAQKPVDPYGEPVDKADKTQTQPVDPYAEPVRVVEAPQTPAVVRVVEAPAATKDAPTTTKDTPVAEVTAPIVIMRSELDAALIDFAKLANAARGAFTPTGLRVDSVLAGSLFAKAGVRGGDTIISVDNAPLRSLDDAATLYARASTARNVTLQVIRGGKPVTLRIAIR